MKLNKTLSIIILISSICFSIGIFLFRDYFKDATSLGLLGIFLINFVSSVTFFVSGPSFLTVIAGGSIYPPLPVAFFASLGAAIGDMVSFFFGYSGRNLIIKKLKKKLWFLVLEGIFRKYGTFILFILAFIPNPIFDALGLVAGILGYSPKKFFAVMFLGRFSRFALFALVGAKYY
jgi:membrane protein YqaA with SNARE-associated domain